MSEAELQSRVRLFVSRVRTLVTTFEGGRFGKSVLREVAALQTTCDTTYRAESPAKLVAGIAATQVQIRTCLQFLDHLGESPQISRTQIAEVLEEGRALIAMTAAIIEAGEDGPPSPPILGGAE